MSADGHLKAKTIFTLIEQLKYFPMADHDDAPDALEGCNALCSLRKKKVIIKKRYGLGI